MAHLVKKIIIVGGGFAGINLAMGLKNRKEFEITLVDCNNYNFFPPLLYQVATGFLEPSAISYPFRRFLRNKANISFRMGGLQKVVPSENKVMLSNGALSYDILILATGAENNYFGMEHVKQQAIPMKTLSDALAMRNIFLNRMEEASRITDIIQRKMLLTIVVAGAGPTGVELSGMFAEMHKNILRKDYPEIRGLSLGEVYLVDGAPAVLAPMSAKSQQYSYESLKELGVKVKLNVTVKDYKDDLVYLSDGSTIATKTLIWAAGVIAKVFEGIPPECYGHGKRIIVDAFNRVKGFENIYAVGDTCFQVSDQFPSGYPQVAQVAIQQAKNLSKNLLRPQNEWQPFNYKDKGSMAIIGRNKAVADIPKPQWHFSGFIAWLVWLFVHVMSLVNYRNRLRTLYNWVGAYFSKDQSFRMIIKPHEKKD